MIWALRIFFTVVLASMLAVTSWASLAVPLWEIPGEVGGHPWFVATLFDAYFGFLTFYVWVVYRERCWIRRLVWLVLILCLGNMAMAIYALLVVCRLPADADARAVLLRPEAGEGKGCA